MQNFLNYEGNEKSNVEKEEENNENIDLVAVETHDEDENDNLVVEVKNKITDVIYVEENLSYEDWLNIMHEMKLIDNLLNGKRTPM